MANSDVDMTPIKGQSGHSSTRKMGEKTHTKDLQLSIFHALGKFLYNKRLPGKGKKPEQLSYKQMANPSKRPALYYRPAEVMA